jgi:hypothetical protein
MLAGAGIAAGTRRSMFDRECAETAQLNTIAARKRSDDFVEDCIHNILHIPLVEMWIVFRNSLNEFGFDHR